ncbi:tyrosine--tRNA ligase, mitochondrial isoform X2 [Toxorhynchites rutilus septentrionalis]|uniref:tyrosine--tRNA ligase, mitochondrial isoform X2 n=1 Tax=Toxorhynchites rutilus septentrionalis TaxID=329112 RepID=UPI0024794813|nr:tyrosine--tRNA ligase, mitochondrial isoform X2 [Toxorhynchites rutilus septentrionalis]
MILKWWNLCRSQTVSQIKRNFTDGNIIKLQDRGFFKDVFPAESVDKARSILGATPQTIYAGFDPTADSLHVGNLLVIIGLLHSQRAGHQPIALLGGATGQIGDPSGRTTERKVMLQESMERNLTSIGGQIRRIFENHQQFLWAKRGQSLALKPVMVVNNADWYRGMNVVEFVSSIGRHFRMGKMLSLTSVQSRLQSESGMSFTEFTYQIFQAYDWVHLLKEHNCRFQLGGSDQMGNITAGHELISRVARKEVFGLTLPLITNEEGDKFGKSAGNAVWLSSERTSPYGLYQFFVRTPDSEVEKLLMLLTFVPLDEIRSIMAMHRRTPELWAAQKRLAQELTLLVHGEEGLKRAEDISSALYGGNVEALGELEMRDISQTFGGAPQVHILAEPGMTVLDVAMRAKCFATQKDATRIITSGGFSINLNKAKNVSEVLVPGVHILKNGISLLRVGSVT